MSSPREFQALVRLCCKQCSFSVIGFFWWQGVLASRLSSRSQRQETTHLLCLVGLSSQIPQAASASASGWNAQPHPLLSHEILQQERQPPPRPRFIRPPMSLSIHPPAPPSVHLLNIYQAPTSGQQGPGSRCTTENGRGAVLARWSSRPRGARQSTQRQGDAVPRGRR